MQVKLTKFAAYHGVENMKFAPKLPGGGYDTKMIPMRYAQSINPSAVVQDAEQYADNRMVCRIPSDMGYQGDIGTTSQDPAIEQAAGFMLPGAAGAISTNVPSYLRGALYYEFTAHGEDGRAVRVKTWMFNTEVGKGSETHATDKASVEFGAFTYPFHCYGDQLLDADGVKPYVDENGMERTAFMIRAVPGDVGYETFGNAVPVPKLAKEENSVKLSGLSIGSLSLSPVFDPDTVSYTAATTNATNAITATAADSGATVAIDVGGTAVTNGQPATWASGANTVTITVTNGGVSKTYTITVTKN